MDKQRRKDIIDCINTKVEQNGIDNNGSKKLKDNLIKDNKKYFKRLNKNKDPYQVVDKYIFPKTNTASLFDYNICIYRGSCGYTAIWATSESDIDKWDIKDVIKFTKHRDDILLDLARKYGCDNTLLTNRKWFRYVR